MGLCPPLCRLFLLGMEKGLGGSSQTPGKVSVGTGSAVPLSILVTRAACPCCPEDSPSLPIPRPQHAQPFPGRLLAEGQAGDSGLKNNEIFLL